MEGLKALIRERLHCSPLVARVLEERPDLQADPAALLAHLEERGLVEDIFASLETTLQRQVPPRQPVLDPAPPPRGDPAAPPAPALTLEHAAGGGGAGGGWQLVLRLAHGRAFLDFLDQREAEGRELQWHVSFGQRRLRSRSFPACVDPNFGETFFFELPAAAHRTALLAHSAPVHLVLVSRGGPGAGEDPWDGGPRNLLSSHLLEWRYCLSTMGPQKLTVELQGVGRRRQLSPGVLHGELELRPSGPSSGLLPDLAVSAQIHTEEQKRTEVMRHVFESLDRWWATYHDLYSARHVRLFAQTEGSLFLPVACFVTPLEVGRALDSPCHALRWVSLTGSEPNPVPESAEPRWHSLPALWAKGRATIEEKAVLLCSLLLGFSLDAWCCLGTDGQGQAHAWALVRSQGDASKPADVVCWDPRTGLLISADDARYLTTYSSIDTLFNHRRMYVCHAGSVARCAFDLSDPRGWLSVPLDEEALDALRMYPAARCPPFADLRPRLWELPLEPEAMEEAIERRLAAVVRSHREATGLVTRFDDHLSQLLHFALANCEMERAAGVPSQAATFEAIVKRICAAEDVFHAVPVQFNHLKVSLYWPAMSDRPSVRSLLAAGAGTAFALRCRVVQYPEGAVAVWVLLAAVGRF